MEPRNENAIGPWARQRRVGAEIEIALPLTSDEHARRERIDRDARRVLVAFLVAESVAADAAVFLVDLCDKGVGRIAAILPGRGDLADAEVAIDRARQQHP